MRSIFTILLAVSFFFETQAQLSPQDAVKAIGRAVNMGNTLDPPNGETTWNNPVVLESHFDDYKNAGFTCVRIPVTWDKHTATTLPFKIDATWMARVEQIVDWGLSRNLVIILNAHHDAWIKDNYNAANAQRFDSIWSQIATRFKGKTDRLIFEILNEPNPMAEANVNLINAQTLKTIRKTNPTRNVVFSGYKWSNAEELVTVAIPNDPYLIGNYHSYDPYPFGLEGTGTYGSDADIQATKDRFTKVANWSVQHNIPILLGEYGVIKKAEYNSRMACFGTVVGQAVAKGFAFAAWEDGGDFKFFNRNEHSWTELKDLLIYGSEKAPYKINISVIDGNVKLQWQNRFTPTGKIVVQRMTDGGIFADYTELANTATEYIDTQSEAGKTFYYRLRFTDGTTEVQSYPVRIAVVPTVRSPFSGSAISIPGTIEAENYDIGGEGLTYHDTEAANQGKEYRLNDGVDVGKHADNAYHVGYGAVGEWIEYTIDVKKAGVYNVTAYVAGPTAGGEFSLQFNGGTKTSFQTPATGDWVIYQTIKKTVSLELGEQIMRFNIDKTGFDIDKLVFSQVSGIDKSSKTAIEFFPNPASKTLNIRGFTSNTNLKIYNSVGKLCENLQIESPEASISVENLCNGVYFVNYTINEQNFSSQISIQH